MIQIIHTKIIFFVVIILFQMSSYSEELRHRPFTHEKQKNCPSLSDNKSWRSYLSQEYALIGLEFYNTENIPPNAEFKNNFYGYLKDSRSPQLVYIYGSPWGTISELGLSFKQFPDGTIVQEWQNHSGDNESAVLPEKYTVVSPLNWRINIKNYIFIFDESGSLYHRDWGLVGQMNCYSTLRM